jgi:hypothetical protein
MKRIGTLFLILSAVLLLPPILRSKAVYVIPTTAATTHFPVTVASLVKSSTPQASITTFVRKEAIQYHVNPDLANCIVSHESQWIGSKVGDIGNVHGESFGLWQIEVKQHDDITQAEALDPFESTDWALSKIAAGHVAWWSTWWKYCK